MSRGLLRAMFRPYVEFDFARMAFDSRVAFTRNTTAARYKPDKLIEFVANNVPRIDHDPVTGAVLGLLLEGQRTNLLPQSVTNTGTVGVFGSGGALPTGWGVPAALGLTVEIVATNIDPVLGGCRVRVHGTTTSGGTFRIQCTPGFSSTVGQTYVGSQFARIVAGTSPTALSIASVNYGGLNLAVQTAASLSAARLIGSAGTSSSATLRHELRFTATNATAYDFTVEITGGQIEATATASSYIPTTTAAISRGEETASFIVPARVVLLGTTYSDGTTAQQAVTPGATYTIPTGTKPIRRIRGYFG